MKQDVYDAAFFHSISEDPFDVDTSSYLSGRYLLRGSTEEGRDSVIEKGIDPTYFIKGKSGLAFYTTTNLKTAIHYATHHPSANENKSNTVISLFKLKDNSKIVTEDQEDDFLDLCSKIGKDNVAQIFRRKGYDGIFTKCFDEVAIYNTDAVEFVCSLKLSELK